MKYGGTLGYFAREAATDLWKRRTIHAISIATIAATLYILGLFLLLMANLASTVSSWAQENRLSVYLAEAASDADRARIAAPLVKHPAVRTVESVSKDEALARFRREFPDLADLALGLDENPFPASLEVTLKDEAADPAAVEALASTLRAEPGVETVRYDLLWVRRVRALLSMIAWAGAGLGVILLGAAVIIISGVIRLNVHARREEIEILRLVGATRAFIRGPFLVEGAFQGTAASLVAITLLVGTWLAASTSARVRNDLLLSLLTGSFTPLWTPAALLAVGLVVGIAGSALSVRRVASASSHA